MSILSRLSFESMAGKPFTDYLNVSTPLDSFADLRSSCLSVLDLLGNFEEVTEGLFQYFELGSKKGVLAPIARGTVKFSRRGKVGIVSTSGWVLRVLRERSLLSDYLAAMALYPHRVTMLHATADFYVASPPETIQAFKAAAYAGELSLTRKGITPDNCGVVMRPDDHGDETGTLYLGQRGNADVWAKIYDKRHQQVSCGFRDPGPLVRVEVACMSGVGATLRDASDPTDIFYHYAGRSLVTVPPDFSGWSPHGEGYVLGERVERSLFERFESLISGSLDIRRLAEMGVALYGRDIAPQAIGRKVVALVSGLT